MIQLLSKPTDQRILLRGTWERFKLMQQLLEDSPGSRLAFYDGEIELRSSGYQRLERNELPGLEALELNVLKRDILLAEIDLGAAIRSFQQGI